MRCPPEKLFGRCARDGSLFPCRRAWSWIAGWDQHIAEADVFELDLAGGGPVEDGLRVLPRLRSAGVRLLHQLGRRAAVALQDEQIFFLSIVDFVGPGRKQIAFEALAVDARVA